MIVRSYLAAGQPDLLPPIASFADWSNLVRSALVWLGCEDPANTMDAARADDPLLSELREIMDVWRTSLPVGEAITCRQMVQWSEVKKRDEHDHVTGELAYPELRDLLLRLAGERGEINTNKLGSKLRKHEKRVISGFRLERDAASGCHVTRWILRHV